MKKKKSNALREIKLKTVYDSEYEQYIKINEFERDLSVIVGDDLKRTRRVDRMVRKANMILGMLKSTFENTESCGKIYVFL